MKMLALTRYGRLGASSRMRTFQYLNAFEAAGIETTVAPLFSDVYVEGLQQGKKLRSEVIHAYLRRMRRLLKASSFDLIWIEKECLPWLPVGIERWLFPKHVPYVLDYDDAVFHRYDQSKNAWVKRLLAQKHPGLMRGAALVVAGNPYIAAVATRAGAQRVEVVPTVIDLERYPLSAASSGAAMGPPTVGWVGQRSTSNFLKPLLPIFQELIDAEHAQVCAVGIDAKALGFTMQSVPWSEQTEVADINTFDIGIMPLADEPFERGKCGYKLIQYMACGLPVIASPVGVNRDMVEEGVNGFLAETTAEWRHALDRLIADPALRQKMGQAGRAMVENRYCLQVSAPRLTGLLLETAGAASKSVQRN